MALWSIRPHSSLDIRHQPCLVVAQLDGVVVNVLIYYRAIDVVRSRQDDFAVTADACLAGVLEV